MDIPKAPILAPTSPKDVLTNIGRSIQWLVYLAKDRTEYQR